MQVRFGMAPALTTGTTASSTGWYISGNATVNFSPAFSTPPAVIFQEDGGNQDRMYRYRIIGFDATMVTVALVANAGNYTPNKGVYIAVGY